MSFLERTLNRSGYHCLQSQAIPAGFLQVRLLILAKISDSFSLRMSLHVIDILFTLWELNICLVSPIVRGFWKCILQVIKRLFLFPVKLVLYFSHGLVRWSSEAKTIEIVNQVKSWHRSVLFKCTILYTMPWYTISASSAWRESTGCRQC